MEEPATPIPIAERRKRAGRYGFRFRGGENTRIEAFTDAAFAFAVTLLMIGGGHVPDSVDALTRALAGLPGYAASFALLCLFWYAHYAWYRRYGIEDGRSTVLSLLLVFLVLIYVYPLHMMFEAAITLGGGSTPLRSVHDWQRMYEIFGIAYASMSIVILLFYLHALQLRDELALDAVELAVTRSAAWRWGIQAAIGLGSAFLAATLLNGKPGVLLAVPGLVYWLIAVAGALLRQRLRHQVAAIGVSP